MKAYIAIKYYQDNKNKVCIENISSALEHNGFETVCITRDIEKWGQVELSCEELMERTFQEIDNSDVIVIDLMEKGVGVRNRSWLCLRFAHAYCDRCQEGVGYFGNA